MIINKNNEHLFCICRRCIIEYPVAFLTIITSCVYKFVDSTRKERFIVSNTWGTFEPRDLRRSYKKWCTLFAQAWKNCSILENSLKMTSLKIPCICRNSTGILLKSPWILKLQPNKSFWKGKIEHIALRPHLYKKHIQKKGKLLHIRAIQCFLFEVSKKPLLLWGSWNVLYSPPLYR